MGDLARDVRLALRGLGKVPSFTVVALVILALGIGATSAIFSVVHAVLLRPLPYPEPDRLVAIWETRLDQGFTRAAGTEANFWDLQERSTAFQAMGAMKFGQMNLTGDASPQRLQVGRVSSGFFAALQPRPVVGRLFLAGEDQPGGDNRVVLLGNAFWRTSLAADPKVVGTSMVLDAERHTVIGVLPRGDLWMDSVDVYVPLVRRAEASRKSFELGVVGRLAPGITADAARANLAAVCRQLEVAYPDDDKGMGADVSPAHEWAGDGDVRRALWVLLGAVGLLLLIACVNLSNLMLTRAIVRKKETAVRVALGADRFRLARQLVTEALVLSLGGAGLGVLIAHGAIATVRMFDPGGIPRLGEAGLNPWVLGFTVVVSLLVGVVTGLVPALLTPTSRLVPDLREGERTIAGSHGQRRLRGALVAAEVALSLVLLVGAGLLVRSFGGVLRADRGLATDNRLVFTVSMPVSYDVARIDDVRDRLLGRLRAMPQVASAACVSTRPFAGNNTGMAILPAEHPREAEKTQPWASWRLVTGDYFKTLGVPLLRGRTFTGQDRQKPPLAVVLSDRLAERLWPGQDPIGRRVSLWAGQGNDPGEVVGVVGSMRERGLDADPTLAVYLPCAGARWSSPDFVLHTTGDPTVLVPTLRAILAEIDPSLPISNVRLLDEVAGTSLAGRRFNMLLMAVLAGNALLLALAGIWGVQTHFVAAQRVEVGVRLAFGATPAHVLGSSIAQGLRPTVFGIAAGLLAAFGLSRLMSTLLFGVTAADAVTYIGVVALLGAAALVSCAIPALRTLRVDPAVTLRGE